MQDRPIIKTAVPVRRYQIGDVTLTLLDHIESGDQRRFRYLLAFVPLGQREPSLYVCAAGGQSGANELGPYRLLVINEVMTEELDSDPRWGDLETFVEQGIQLGAQLLGLQQEQIVRLL